MRCVRKQDKTGGERGERGEVEEKRTVTASNEDHFHFRPPPHPTSPHPSSLHAAPVLRRVACGMAATRRDARLLVAPMTDGWTDGGAMLPNYEKNA